MICVLEVIDGPAHGKRIWLNENQSLEVGRVSTADFSIPSDSHMSRRHLFLESMPNGFRVRDVGSANGTFVNNARITSVELHTGDIIRAGMTVFSVSIKNAGENPHDRDGLSFGQSTTIRSTTATMTERERHGTIRSMEGLEKFDCESTVKIQDSQKEANKPVLSAETKELEQVATARVAWWKQYFKNGALDGTFEQTSPLSTGDNFEALANEFAKEFQLIGIVNQGQLAQEGVVFLQRLFVARKIETISWSICLVKLDDSMMLTQLIHHCQRRDAMILLGRRTSLELSELKPFANPLSYPSMFSKHILDPETSLRKTLLKKDLMALFESTCDGPIVLLING